jgi:hypothetical protein
MKKESLEERLRRHPAMQARVEAEHHVANNFRAHLV